MKEKTFLVIYQEETDGETFITRMAPDEIEKKFYKNEGYPFSYPYNSFAIIDGEVIKNFSTRFDINRLK